MRDIACVSMCVCMCKEMELRYEKKISVTELGWGLATQYYSIPTSLCPAAVEQQSTQHWKRKIQYFYSYCEQQTSTINKQNKQTNNNNNNNNNLTVVPCWPLLPQRHRPAQLRKGSQQCCATHTETPETARKRNRWWQPQGFPTLHSLGEKQTMCTTGNQLHLCWY